MAPNGSEALDVFQAQEILMGQNEIDIQPNLTQLTTAIERNQKSENKKLITLFSELIDDKHEESNLVKALKESGMTDSSDKFFQIFIITQPYKLVYKININKLNLRFC